MYKLSIIIPIYNVEKYIKDCLESILIQITSEIEVILINDGTRDDSMKVVEKILEQQKITIQNQFVIINQNNQGLSCTRNNGIKIARSKYIAFLDSDDKLMPNYIESIIKEIDKSDYDIIDFNILTSSNTVIYLYYRNKQCLDSLFKAGSWYSCARVVKKDLIAKYKFMPNIYYEDLALTPQLYLDAMEIKHIDMPLYWYRYNEEGITNNKSSDNNKKTFESLQKIMYYYLDLYLSTKNPYYARLILNCLYLLYTITILRIGPKNTLRALKLDMAVFTNTEIFNFVKSNNSIKFKHKILYRYPKLYLLFFYIIKTINKNT